MANNNYFNRVLYVGMDYKVPKGGIASVLNTYSSFVRPFKFVRTHASELNRIQKIWYAASGYVMIVWKLMTDKDIQIVHIHTASNASFWRKSYAIRIAKAMSKKVIFHCHGGGFKEFRENNRDKVDAILSKVDCIVCLSDVWKEYFEGIGCKNVTIIKNVIGNPKPMAIEKDGLIHFLFLGLICDNKGIFDVLNVLSEHKDELAGKILLHVGGNGQTERLLSKIEEYGIEEVVVFEGWVDKEKKQHLLNLADVFLLPSYIEGVPISILEAESYHKPVITTNVGGIPSIVKDHISGLFVRPGNTNDIYTAMKKISEGETLRYQYGEAGYEISKGYLPDTIKKELIKLYDKMLNNSCVNSYMGGVNPFSSYSIAPYQLAA